MKSRNRVLYYGKKAAAFLASVLLLSVLVFYISRLAPGDPLVSYYGDRVEKMTPEERAWAEEKLGLNDPISVQYIRWAGNALHGDFGISYKYKMDVTRVIEGRIGNTLVLGGIGFLLIFTLALLLGIFCAWKEDTWLDRIICKVGTITGILAVAASDSCFFHAVQMAAEFRCLLCWKTGRFFRPCLSSDPADDGRSAESFVVLRIHDPQ